jgi:two-component sensor histidine kinase
MVGRDGVIQAANATFASRVGLTPEACVGTSLYGIGDPDMVAARRIHLERVLATGEPDVFEDERDGRCTHHALYPVKERGTTDRVVVYASDITERRRAEAQIAALLREKETLLKETHHRVKNNMSAVASLLSLQSYEMPDGPAAEALLEAASRVQSMSVMYDKLYRTERADALPADDFIRSLVEEALEATGRSGRVRAKIVAEAFQLPAATLTPLGIALNELVSNSLKHAFEGVAEPEILVWAERSDDSVCLSYRDNGKGIPMNVDFDGNTGFGMRLIQMLARQLGGDSRIERDGAGSAVVIRFKARRC